MFSVAQRDTLPYVEAILSSNSSNVLDLTNSTGVQFVWGPVSRQFNPVTGNAVILGTASTGYVKYSWTTTDLQSGGYFYYRWIANFSGGNRVSMPNDGFGMFHTSMGL